VFELFLGFVVWAYRRRILGLESKGGVGILYLEENNGRLGIIIVSLLLVGMGMELKRQGWEKGVVGKLFSCEETNQEATTPFDNHTEVNNLEREIKRERERFECVWEGEEVKWW